MNLASPWMLLALLAVAAPIYLHLTKRQDQEERSFPSLMFLKHVVFKEKSSLTLRDIALLALRCAIVALLALAFAGPWFSGNNNLDLKADSRATVMLLDRSYSMAADSRFEAAVELADLRVNNIESDESLALVVFDETTEVLELFTNDKGSLRSALVNLEPTSHGTNLSNAFGTAKRLLEQEQATKSQVLLISDLQASAIEQADSLLMTSGSELEIIRVGDELRKLTNASIDGIDIERADENLETRATVRVRNTGNTTIDTLTVNLAVNETPQTPITTQVPPQAEVSVEFPVVLANDRPTLLDAKIDGQGDALVADNRFFAVAVKTRQLKALIVEPDRPRANQSLYLKRALALDRINTATTVVGVSDLAAQNLDDFDLVMLNDVAITRRITEQLQQFTTNGGGMLTIAGSNANSAWGGERDELALSSPHDDDSQSHPDTTTVRVDVTDHPMSMVQAFANGGSLANLSVKTVALAPARAGTRSILSVSGGQALLSATVPEIGRAQRELFLGTTVDPSGSTLALEPGFVSFMENVVNYLGNRHTAPSWVQTGTAVDIKSYLGSMPGARISPNVSPIAVVESPDDQEHVISATDTIYIPVKPGLHELHSGVRTGTPQALAVNVARHESNLMPAQDVDVRSRLRSPGQNQSAESTSPRDASQSGVRKRDFAWILLLLAAILLLIESFVANRLTLGRGDSHIKPAG